jgi:hypothetical protein
MDKAVKRWAAHPGPDVVGFVGDRLMMSAAFDALPLAQKKERLHQAQVAWFAQATPQELQAIKAALKDTEFENPKLPLPQAVVDHVGRELYFTAGGCYSATLWTERDRFIHHHSIFEDVEPFHHEWRRNVGNPPWRTMTHRLDAATELAVRKAFWKAVGYANAGEYFIAWVPETGRFEVDVRREQYTPALPKRLRQVIPARFKFDILDFEGVPLN